MNIRKSDIHIHGPDIHIHGPNIHIYVGVMDMAIYELKNKKSYSSWNSMNHAMNSVNCNARIFGVTERIIGGRDAPSLIWAA